MTNEKQISSDRALLNKKDSAIREQEILTNAEAARYLRCSPITLWRLRKNGKISFHRIAGKLVYTREDLENFLERNKQDAFAVNS